MGCVAAFSGRPRERVGRAPRLRVAGDGRHQDERALAAREGQGAPRRRRRRRRRRDQPRARQGRRGARRGRLGAAPGRHRPAQGDGGRRPARPRRLRHQRVERLGVREGRLAGAAQDVKPFFDDPDLVKVKMRHRLRRLIPNAMEPRGVVRRCPDVARRVHDRTRRRRSRTSSDRPRRSRAASPRRSCGSWPRTWAAASARSSRSTPRSCSAWPSPGGSTARSSGPRSDPRATLATIHGRGLIQDMEMAATRTVGSRPSVQLRSPNGRLPPARHARDPDARRPGSTAGYNIGATTSSTPACSRTRRRPTRTAARAGPRRPTRSSGRSTRWPARSGWTPWRSAGRTSSPPSSPTSPRASWSTRATTSRHSTKALEMVGYDDLRAEQAQRRRPGAPRSSSASASRTYVEMCGLAPSPRARALRYVAGGWEAATVRVLPTGKVQVVTGTSPHGQGHETCWSMIARRQLGVASRTSSVLHADTAIAPLGLDTYGSVRWRSAGPRSACGREGAREGADSPRTSSKSAEDDLEYEDGRVPVKGTDKAREHQATRVRGVRPRTTSPTGWSRASRRSTVCDPPNFTFPFGAHIGVVEVDTETGSVELKRTSPSTTAATGQSADRRGPGARRHRAGHRAGALRGGRLRRRTATSCNGDADRLPGRRRGGDADIELSRPSRRARRTRSA